MFIPDPDPDFLPNPDPRVKKAPDTGPGPATVPTSHTQTQTYNRYCTLFVVIVANPDPVDP
jgi:hypothetical protein